MKKNYQKPVAEIYMMNSELGLMAGSDYVRKMSTVRKRDFIGDDVTDGEFPEIIDLVGDDDDPFGGKGQGTGGNTNRSKDFDLWEDTGW